MKKSLVLMIAVVTIAAAIVPVSALAVNKSQSATNGSDPIIGPGPSKPFNALDLALMKEYLLSGSNGYFKPEWDVNKDGVFDVFDYAAIRKMLLLS